MSRRLALGAKQATPQIRPTMQSVPGYSTPSGSLAEIEVWPRAVCGPRPLSDAGARLHDRLVSATVTIMALEYFEWEVQGVSVLHLQGSITLGEGTQRLRQLIHQKLEQGKLKIVLNMAEVYYMDSSGLGELIASHTTARHRGGRLKLMKLSPRVQDLVQLTKVHRVFEVFPDEDSAVRSFEPQPG